MEESIIKTNMTQENNYVSELIELMKEQGLMEASKSMESLADSMKNMENKCNALSRELADVKQQLRERQLEVPALLKKGGILDNSINQSKKEIANINEMINTVSKDTVSNFKQSGKVLLGKVLKSLHIREALEFIRQNLDDTIKSIDNVLASLELAGQELKKSQFHRENIARAIWGKDILPEEDAGKLPEVIKVLQVPLILAGKIFEELKGHVNNAIVQTEKLQGPLQPARTRNDDKKTDTNTNETQKEPASILAKLKEKQEQVKNEPGKAPERQQEADIALGR